MKMVLVFLLTVLLVATATSAEAYRYEMMRPGQIRDAIDRGVPLLIPTGVLEYHGPHNPIGVDALIAQGIAHRVAKEAECVVAPTVFYGYTGRWGGGVKEGEIHIEGGELYPFVRPMIKAFYDQGWKRIYIILHHQGATGVTWITYQRVATELAMEEGHRLGGDGWSEAENLPTNIWSRIRVVSDSQFSNKGYGGHGGKGETMAMMFLYPETVNLSELAKADKLPRWAKDADQADPKEAEEIGKAIIGGWIKEISKK
ncbi:MAG: creatininase family protein [Kiritimatiellota bacterium]|nr:creatininase family protein [Kiritimatiellota bacterium]